MVKTANLCVFTTILNKETREKEREENDIEANIQANIKIYSKP